MNFEKIYENSKDIGSHESIIDNTLTFLNDSFEDIEDDNIRKEKFDRHIEEISFEDFEKWLIDLNGELKGIPPDKRGFSEAIIGGDRTGVNYLPPSPEHRKDLLEDVFESLKRIPNSVDKGAFLYYVIQAMHLFSDGNGRTGRVIYEYFRNNGKDFLSEELDQLMSGHESKDDKLALAESRESFYCKVLDPIIVFRYINDFLAKDILEDDGIYYIQVLIYEDCPLDIRGSDKKDEVKKIFSEKNLYPELFPFNALVVYDFLRQKNLLDKYSSSRNNEKGKEISIKPYELTPNLTEDDFDIIITIHKELKVKFVKKLIDVFENPEEYKISMKDGSDCNFKDGIIADSEKIQNNNID